MDNHHSQISRRHFLKSGAILGGGLLISFTSEKAGLLARTPGLAKPFVPNSFLHITPDNNITIILTHVEMGQGIWTTLPMLLAEELDADWKNIKVVHGPAGKAYNHAVFGIQITGGSSSTWSEFDRYRQAGATARILLTQAAAKRFGTTPDNCKTANGLVLFSGKKLSYGQLANEAALLPVPEKVELRPPTTWKYIGKGKKRLDAPAKVNGTAVFGMDIQFPGLLTAVVAHAPVFGGKVKSFDPANALAVPGVRQVVEIPTGVAIIADHYWAATQGRKALQVKWDDGKGAEQSTGKQIEAYKKLAATDGLPASQKGNVKQAFNTTIKTVEAEYVFPYLAHSAMEPINCTVKITANKCEIWTGTQMPGIDQGAAATILGFKPEQVEINTPFLGGGFGRRATPNSDFVSEAVQIAKASGKTIKMVWSREDDMKGGYYRPAYVHKAKVGLDNENRIIAWHHNIAGQSILDSSGGFFASMIKNGIDDSSVEGVSDSPYLSSVPDYFVGLHTTREAVPVLWYRSVGHTHTAYVMETMMDELAHAAGQDPVAFRRTLLTDHPRHLRVLNLAAEKAKWNTPLPQGHYRGVAVHESFQSFVAHVVEISMVKGQVKVHKITCAIDCGLAVNPDGVKAQMESGIIFGITMALYGEITVDKGVIQQSNFYDYKIVRMHEAPVIEVYIADSTDKMGGAGECGVPPTAPALANAIFAATGKRIYQLPVMNNNLNAI